MPSLVWLERNLETEPPIGRDGLARCARYRDGHCTVKIPVRVRSANLLPSLRPLSGDLAAAHDTSRLHLEDVGEIAAEGDLELKTHRLHAVVGDVEIFVHAAADRSADGEAERARENWTVFREKGLVGKEDACRVVADGTAVQQLPRLAVGVNRPTADDPRIKKVKTLFARPIDLPVRLADEDRLALMDGDLRWTNLNLERHHVLLTATLSAAAAAIMSNEYALPRS